MGCGQSNQSPDSAKPIKPKVEKSVLMLDYTSMIADLAQVNVIQLASCVLPEGRKASIGSVMTGEQPDFEEKPVEIMGDLTFLSEKQSIGLGCVCKKSLKPGSPNQDAWMVLEMEGVASIYGVFDGHGQNGHNVSHFVNDYLPKLIITDARFQTDELPACLAHAFQQAQGMVITADKNKKVSAQFSGTTVTVVVHEHVKNRLTFAHCADSTAVVGMWEDSSRKTLKVAHATRDHKPELEDEKQQIEKNGGEVKFDGYVTHRVYVKDQRYPGLAMSRCMGDLKGHFEAGLTALPEIDVVDIAPNHHVLLNCSDGVWEFIKPQEAVDFVGKQPPEKAKETAEALSKMAWDRWIVEEKGTVVDDITVILVYLNVGSSAAATAIGVAAGA